MSHEELIESSLSYFNDSFEELLSENYNPCDELTKAIHYALDGKGKRVRPLLTLLSNYAFDGVQECALPASMAIEMIHTYSLVHDDLPCMDDDDLRRGRPTVHKVFGQPIALLAGDALLTDAFEVLSTWSSHGLSDNRKVQLVAELANAAGSRGMVWGQSKDLYWTGRAGGTEEDIDDIHLAKTGALMGSACAMGAISAGATLEEASIFRKFGKTIGLAFQIYDDILDEEDGTGKTKGKDLDLGKLTYLKFMNYQEAKLNAEQLTHAAIDSIQSLSLNTDPLIHLCESLLNRKN